MIQGSRCRSLWLPALLVSAVLMIAGCRERAAVPEPPATAKGAAAVDLAAVRPQVEQFCGDCHRTPLPESFPRDRWLHEVERGYEFYLLSGRSDLTPPPRGDVLAYYQSQAPEQLQLPPVSGSSSTRFTPAPERELPPADADQAIAHVVPLSSIGMDGDMAFCDMRAGQVRWLDSNTAGEAPRIMQSVQLENPCHLTATDLDSDGQSDYVVADLGSFLPEDHLQGRVVWLRPAPQSESGFQQTVLLDGVGRVADVQPADIDGDGDKDLVVAVFGWHATGDVLLLVNDGATAAEPKFTPRVLDKRSGAIHAPVADLNGDARPDIVVLFSQEHESIEALLQQADGSFAKQVLYAAPDPSYGSSGIELVDLDADGDLDVLYTNGDTFDSYYVKPYHAIRWIENAGDQWREHELAKLPGVSRALTGDLDGDGDLDVAAASFIAPESIARQPEANRFVSLLWLEQQAGRFQQHNIEFDNCVHAALALADVNGDDRLDILAGNWGQSGERRLPPYSVWLNSEPSIAAKGAEAQ